MISMFTVPPPSATAEAGSVDARKGEYRAAAQSALQAFAALLGDAAGDPRSVEVRKTAMSAIKQVGIVSLPSSHNTDLSSSTQFFMKYYAEN